ncbi:uncharacterized protein T069G_11179 [Trichoderma breve]|uniref:Uncharacterized protein n=1 Tax=Trichoderma breve TaxID=2034170 RepID=A0A9W9B297_9HYPO|nr:uncharacterized protein T069G_11179 [Trichoderma breve]KAJ4854200.1 hypothetical protein T069G_11179 [Trichoderma breve]
MKTSAVIVAACAAVAGAVPTYRFGNWNSTVVNWNTSTPTNWNTTTGINWNTTTIVNWNSTAIANGTVAVNTTVIAASAPSTPYYPNTTVSINNTWVNQNETHLPPVLIRRFRALRKTVV